MENEFFLDLALNEKLDEDFRGRLRTRLMYRIQSGRISRMEQALLDFQYNKALDLVRNGEKSNKLLAIPSV